MATRGLGSARTRVVARGLMAILVLLGTMVVAPAARAATSGGPFVVAAPTCVLPGVATRVLIVGAGWADGAVVLTQTGLPNVLGTATARTSPVRHQAGSFSFTTPITAAASFVITAGQGDLTRSTGVTVQTSCPLQISVKPTCLNGPGRVQVSGAGFAAGSQVPIDVDPFGDAEVLPQTTTADGSGGIAVTLGVPFRGVAVPIMATRPSAVGTVFVPPARAVVFVDPCPPPPTTTTTTRPPSVTTTSTRAPATTTTATTVPVPPAIPPATVPTPGARALATISPTTVRPGRCAVVVISAAPATTPVVARFADRPSVGGQTGPTGLAVLSLCEPHNSGAPLGTVKVLIGIGPGPPVPVFDELRVPRRPEPPLLQSGADIRRS